MSEPKKNPTVCVTCFYDPSAFWFLYNYEICDRNKLIANLQKCSTQHKTRSEASEGEKVLINYGGTWARAKLADIKNVDISKKEYICWLIDYGVFVEVSVVYELLEEFRHTPGYARRGMLFGLTSIIRYFDFEVNELQEQIELNWSPGVRRSVTNTINKPNVELSFQKEFELNDCLVGRLFVTTEDRVNFDLNDHIIGIGLAKFDKPTFVSGLLELEETPLRLIYAALRNTTIEKPHKDLCKEMGNSTGNCGRGVTTKSPNVRSSLEQYNKHCQNTSGNTSSFEDADFENNLKNEPRKHSTFVCAENTASVPSASGRSKTAFPGKKETGRAETEPKHFTQKKIASGPESHQFSDCEERSLDVVESASHGLKFSREPTEKKTESRKIGQSSVEVFSTEDKQNLRTKTENAAVADTECGRETRRVAQLSSGSGNQHFCGKSQGRSEDCATLKTLNPTKTRSEDLSVQQSRKNTNERHKLSSTNFEAEKFGKNFRDSKKIDESYTFFDSESPNFHAQKLRANTENPARKSAGRGFKSSKSSSSSQEGSRTDRLEMEASHGRGFSRRKSTQSSSARELCGRESEKQQKENLLGSCSKKSIGRGFTSAENVQKPAPSKEEGSKETDGESILENSAKKSFGRGFTSGDSLKTVVDSSRYSSSAPLQEVEASSTEMKGSGFTSGLKNVDSLKNSVDSSRISSGVNAPLQELETHREAFEAPNTEMKRSAGRGFRFAAISGTSSVKLGPNSNVKPEEQQENAFEASNPEMRTKIDREFNSGSTIKFSVDSAGFHRHSSGTAEESRKINDSETPRGEFKTSSVSSASHSSLLSCSLTEELQEKENWENSSKRCSGRGFKPGSNGSESVGSCLGLKASSPTDLDKKEKSAGFWNSDKRCAGRGFKCRTSSVTSSTESSDAKEETPTKDVFPSEKSSRRSAGRGFILEQNTCKVGQAAGKSTTVESLKSAKLEKYTSGHESPFCGGFTSDGTSSKASSSKELNSDFSPVAALDAQNILLASLSKRCTGRGFKTETSTLPKETISSTETSVESTRKGNAIWKCKGAELEEKFEDTSTRKFHSDWSKEPNSNSNLRQSLLGESASGKKYTGRGFTFTKEQPGVAFPNNDPSKKSPASDDEFQDALDFSPPKETIEDTKQKVEKVEAAQTVISIFAENRTPADVINFLPAGMALNTFKKSPTKTASSDDTASSCSSRQSAGNFYRGPKSPPQIPRQGNQKIRNHTSFRDQDFCIDDEISDPGGGNCSLKDCDSQSESSNIQNLATRNEKPNSRSSRERNSASEAGEVEAPQCMRAGAKTGNKNFGHGIQDLTTGNEKFNSRSSQGRSSVAGEVEAPHFVRAGAKTGNKNFGREIQDLTTGNEKFNSRSSQGRSSVAGEVEAPHFVRAGAKTGNKNFRRDIQDLTTGNEKFKSRSSQGRSSAGEAGGVEAPNCIRIDDENLRHEVQEPSARDENLTCPGSFKKSANEAGEVEAPQCLSTGGPVKVVTGKCECKTCQSWRDNSMVFKNLSEEPPVPRSSKKKSEKPALLLRPLGDEVQNHGPMQSALELKTDISRLQEPRILVHKNISVRPVSELYEVPFHAEVHKGLRNLGYEKTIRVQTYAWPAVMRGIHVFVVGTPQTGKTMVYVPAFCTFVLQNNPMLPECKGPIALMLCPGVKVAEDVYKMVKKLLGLQREKRVTIVVPPFKNAIFEGEEILICTPPTLLTLLKEEHLKFKRLTHVAFENADLLLELFPQDMEVLLQVFQKTLEKRNFIQSIQMVTTARQWTPPLEKLAKRLKPVPFVCIGAYLEAALYGRADIQIQFVNSADKPYQITQIVSEKSKIFKTLIICSDTKEVTTSLEYLNTHGVNYQLLNEKSRIEDIQDISKRWSTSVCGKYFVLVCTDYIISTSLPILDASVIIQYSLPDSWTQCVFRFSCFTNNYQSPLKTQKDKESNRCKMHILVDESNVAQLPRLVQFLKRMGQTLSPSLLKHYEGVLQQFEAEKIKDKISLCQKLLQFGSCSEEVTCSSRHALSPTLDISNIIPQSGIISLKILHIRGPTSFFARLTEHTNSEGIVHSIVNKYALIAARMSQLTNREMRKSVLDVQIGSWCAVEESKGLYMRAEVVEILKVGHLRQPSLVAIRLVDTGQEMKASTSKLYLLPEGLQEIAPQAIEVHIANLGPPDKDTSWSEHCVTKIKNIFKKSGYEEADCYFSGRIKLQIGNTLFVQNLILQERLEDGALVVNRLSVRRTLLKHRLAEERPQCLKQLYDLCDTYKISLPDYTLPVIKKSAAETRQKYRWAHLENLQEYNLVYFCAAFSPDHFYVRLCANQKLLDDLTRDIQEVTKTRNKNFVVVKGGCYLAKDPEEDFYARVIVLELKDEDAECFFVDYGDKTTVPASELKYLPPKLSTRLPFQVIECKLWGVAPTGKEWRSESVDILYDFAFEPETELLRFLHVKVMDEEPSEITQYKKYAVILIDTFDGNTIVNDLFCKMGHAKPTTNAAIKVDFEKLRLTFTNNNNNNSNEGDQENEELVETVQEINGVGEIYAENGEKYPLSFDPDHWDLQINNPKEFFGNIAREVRHVNTPKEEIKNRDVDVKRIKALPSSGFSTPDVVWQQTDSQVTLRIQITDVTDYDIFVLRQKIFSFKTTCRSTVYKVDLNLYAKVRPELEHSPFGLYVLVKLTKQTNEEWPRLVANTERLRYITYNVAVLPTDDSDDDDAALEPSKFEMSKKAALDGETGAFTYQIGSDEDYNESDIISDDSSDD